MIHIIINKILLKETTMNKSLFAHASNRLSYLQSQLQEDVLIDKRIIYFDTMIDLSSISFLQQRIGLITDISGDNESPITIMICSYGGDAYALFAIVDLIKSVPMKINIHGRGAIMSAGAIILISATGIRSMSPSAVMMIHSVQSMVQGSIEEVQQSVNQSTLLNDRMIQLLAQATNQPPRFWKKETKSDRYLTAEECKKLGLIDIIQ